MQFNARLRVSPVERWILAPGKLLLVGLIVFKTASAGATILSSNLVCPWTPGVTVGIPGGVIPARTHLLNVSQSPYNADKTGVIDATAAINAAIKAAKNNDVVYIPTGRYLLKGTISAATSGITIRGDGPANTILIETGSATPLSLGPTAFSFSTNLVTAVTGGATKGSTQLIVQSTSMMTAGNEYKLREKYSYDPNFPVLTSGLSDYVLSQDVIVTAVSGNTVTVTPPLCFDFTNQAQLVWIQNQVCSGLGVEGLAITCTNTVTGALGTAQVGIMASCLANCWITNCDVSYIGNYFVFIGDCVNCWVVGNAVHQGVSQGSNHSGLILGGDSGLLVENNIFANGLAPAIEFNAGTDGSAFFGNMFTNCGPEIDCHGAHPLMDLWEENLVYGTYELDGYFGSCSHQTLFRNLITGGGWNAIKLDRFSSYVSLVGNVLGQTTTSHNNPWTYLSTNNNGSMPAILALGYPNIGNFGFLDVTPTNEAWNFPGTQYGNPGYGTAFIKAGYLTNGIYTFPTTQGPTTVLYGNFTNLIYGPLWYGAPLVFQDNINTNIYHTDGWHGLGAVTITNSSMTLTEPFTVQAGWTVYAAGPGAWQNYDARVAATTLIHGNYDFANKAVTWSPAIADHSVPTSILYPSGPPSWWTGNWPAIDPNSPNVSPNAIPAGYRYANTVGSVQANRPYPPVGLHVIGTNVQ